MHPGLLGSVKQTGPIDLRGDYIQNPLFVGGFFFWVVVVEVFYVTSVTIKDKESACGGDPDPVTLR